MKRFILFSVLFVLLFSCPASAAIVYSGSQNVSLTLGPMQTMSSMTISVAGSAEHWDDFIVDLWWYEMMGTMGMGTMGTHLVIYAPMSMTTMTMFPVGMALTGGIVGFTDVTSGLPGAMNLAFGDIIGPASSLVNWANLYDAGIGQFGADGGYIGLMMPGSSYYAWLHMSSQSNMGTNTHSLVFDGWAYEDQSGTPIGAGVIPVPAALFLGGFGTALVAWLKMRKAV